MPHVSLRGAKRGAALRRQDLAITHLPLVRHIARRMRQTLPARVELDDLIGAGMIGLLDATRKFDAERNISFRAYAKHRIRGAITDSLRGMDSLPRDMRRKHRVAQKAIAELTQQLQREPDEAEIAWRLRMQPERWRQLAKDFTDAGCPLNGYDSLPKPTPPVEHLESRQSDPEELSTRAELRRVLNGVLGTLPPRYQQVIRLYYEREWTMNEIARELQVNESRVSQIHKAAICRMRAHLEQIDAKIKEGIR